MFLKARKPMKNNLRFISMYVIACMITGETVVENCSVCVRSYEYVRRTCICRY